MVGVNKFSIRCINNILYYPGRVVNGILRGMNLDDFLKLKLELLAQSSPPLKTVKMSKVTAATLPTVPTQSEVETLYGVPIEWDDTLSEGEYVPVYQ